MDTQAIAKVTNWEVAPDVFPEDIPTVTEHKEILKEATKYYEYLFAPKPCDPTRAQKYLKLYKKRKVATKAAEICEGMIDHDENNELYSTLCKLPNGSSAGPDGIPNEFYKQYHSIISGPLTRALNEGFSANKLHKTFTSGIVSLLYKKKNRSDLRNYRPITLLNCDYKILTRILTKRLNPAIDTFASIDNTGFYPKRFIAENSIGLKLMQAYLDEEKKPGALVFLDMEKAFDRVSWDYMHKALEAAGFGHEFRKWIHMLYNKDAPPKRRIDVNGHLGKEWNLGSGVAQGCPLSPLLFLIVSESLTRAVNADRNIKGVTVQGREIKLSQFADDTVLILRNLRSWESAKNRLKDFGHVSGQKLNELKTEGLLCGTLRGSHNPPSDITWCPEGQYLISLGVPIGQDRKSVV